MKRQLPESPRTLNSRAKLLPMSDLNAFQSRLDLVLRRLQQGEMVIVLDAQDRENEGDLLCAAQFITPEKVDFMMRRAAGLLCAPLTQEVAERLQLTPIVDQQSNTAPHQTPFLMLVDHRDSGTGISAASRALTLNALADPDSQKNDFVKPGHVNPLLARDGGVLRRAGHTEASIDLLKMAGLTPVGCIIEICSQRNFEMASLDELQAFFQRT